MESRFLGFMRKCQGYGYSSHRLKAFGNKGEEKNKMLIRWVVDLRRHCFKIREIAKYLKAEHIESIERTP